MAWIGSTPPKWCKYSFDEYKSNLGQDWSCKLLTSMSVPESFILYKEYDKLPFLVYKADIFRLWLLSEYGGIWCDTDTRLVKPFDNNLLDHDSFATVHRNKPESSLDSFHIDSCIIGAVPKAKMIDTVIERAYEEVKTLGYTKFRWTFNTTLTGKCPDYIYYGPFDEIANQQERHDFVNYKFTKVIPKRTTSYIRHYLTNLYQAQ